MKIIFSTYQKPVFFGFHGLLTYWANTCPFWLEFDKIHFLIFYGSLNNSDHNWTENIIIFGKYPAIYWIDVEILVFSKPLSSKSFIGLLAIWLVVFSISICWRKSLLKYLIWTKNMLFVCIHYETFSIFSPVEKEFFVIIEIYSQNQFLSSNFHYLFYYLFH